MMYHRCEILIPKLYGVRRVPVEAEVLAKFVKIFNVQFGGATPLGETGLRTSEGKTLFGGTWTNPKTGEVVDDTCWLFRIYVAPGKLDLFREVALEIGK
jgi:hypothetical protein